MAKKQEPDLKKFVKELFDLMSIKAEVEVEKDAETNAYLVNINAKDETGLLIGKKGDTLYSIQYILGLYLKKTTGEWERVVVNVGDWREKQEEYLKNIATQALDKLKETNQPQPIYNLSAGQRRIVHMALKDIKGITTESQGEEPERYIVVKYNKK